LAQGLLKWQAEIRPDEFAGNWSASARNVRQTFAALGSRGLVGFDLSRGAYYHRELPFDLALVEDLHPRLRNARKIVQSAGVRIIKRDEETIEAEVAGSNVIHRARLSEAGDRCTCPWHAKHQGSRGPCKHILAVQIAAEPDMDYEPSK
jgi:SWIM zinc finger